MLESGVILLLPDGLVLSNLWLVDSHWVRRGLRNLLTVLDRLARVAREPLLIIDHFVIQRVW